MITTHLHILGNHSNFTSNIPLKMKKFKGLPGRTSSPPIGLSIILALSVPFAAARLTGKAEGLAEMTSSQLEITGRQSCQSGKRGGDFVQLMRGCEGKHTAFSDGDLDASPTVIRDSEFNVHIPPTGYPAASTTVDPEKDVIPALKANLEGTGSEKRSGTASVKLLQHELKMFEDVLRDKAPVGELVRESGMMGFLPRFMNIFIHYCEGDNIGEPHGIENFNFQEWTYSVFKHIELTISPHQTNKESNPMGPGNSRLPNTDKSISLHLLRGLYNAYDIYNLHRQEVNTDRLLHSLIQFRLQENQSLLSMLYEAIKGSEDFEVCLKRYKEECNRINSYLGDLSMETVEPQPFETRLEWGGHVNPVDCERLEIQLRRLLFLEMNKPNTFQEVQAEISGQLTGLKFITKAMLRRFVEGQGSLIDPLNLPVSTSRIITYRNQLLSCVRSRAPSVTSQGDSIMELDPLDFSQMLSDLEESGIGDILRRQRLIPEMNNWLELGVGFLRRSDASEGGTQSSSDEFYPSQSPTSKEKEPCKSLSQLKAGWEPEVEITQNTREPSSAYQSELLPDSLSVLSETFRKRRGEVGGSRIDRGESAKINRETLVEQNNHPDPLTRVTQAPSQLDPQTHLTGSCWRPRSEGAIIEKRMKQQTRGKTPPMSQERMIAQTSLSTALKTPIVHWLEHSLGLTPSRSRGRRRQQHTMVEHKARFFHLLGS